MIPAGNFFFRTRNWLFPLVLVCTLAIFQPRPLGDPAGLWMMIGGAALLVFGQGVRIVTIGLDYIKRGGKDGRIYAERLVTGGVYAHCRNPMYVGNVSISLGYYLLAGNLIGLAVGGGFFIFAYMAITLSEEAFLRSKFGEEYEQFCARSPRWLPSPRHALGLLRTIRSYRFDWPAVIVKEYGTIFVTAALSIGILAWKAQRAGAFDIYWPWLAAGLGAAGAFWCLARWLKKGLKMKPRGVTLTQAGLEQHRQVINAIDAQILRLLNRRAVEVSTIFEIKRALSLPRFNEARTELIFARLKALNEGPLTDEQMLRLFDGILRYFAFEHDRPKDAASPSAGDESAASPPPTVETYDAMLASSIRET